MKRNTLKKIIVGVLISITLFGIVLPSKALANTSVKKQVQSKNVQRYSFKGYQNGVPVYTSTIKSENLQCSKTQDSIKQMINNLDNFGLYYVALTEINKVNDLSVRNTYKAVIDKYRKQSATPYITDILNKLNALKKAPNLLDYSNLLNDVKASKLKQDRDLKYNVAYVQNEINSWVNSGKLYTRPETDAIKLVKIAQNMGTVKNIDNAKKAISLVKNLKSAKWLNGEINKVQIIDQVKTLPFRGATLPVVHPEFLKYNNITVKGDFLNLLNQTALYITGDIDNRFAEVNKVWMNKIVSGKYKIVKISTYSTNVDIESFVNLKKVLNETGINEYKPSTNLYYEVYNAQQENPFGFVVCRFIVEFKEV